MKNKKLKAMAIGISLMLLLSGCGGKTEEIAEVTTDNLSEVEAESEIEVPDTVEDLGEEEGKEEEPEPEEIEEEPLAVCVPYVEENKLEFCDVLTVAGKGVRIDINESSVYEEVDAECAITDVSIEELEDETKEITIKYEVMGEIYDSTGRRFLQIILPNAIYCDLNTGEFQPVAGETLWDSEEEIDYTIEWNGITYDITQTKAMEWSKKMDWHSDGKNGYVSPVTMYITDTFIVPKDYDGMGMVIGIFTAEEVYSGEYELFGDNQPSILEVLENREDARLYSINELCELFSEDETVADDKDNGSTAPSNNGTSKENTNNSHSKDDTTPKQEEKKEQQNTHTHSYSESVTKNPTCSESGVRTYTCSSCRDTYTETIAKTDHQWVPVTESVYHPSTGHYETVTSKILFCNCGFTCSSQSELNSHFENDGCNSTTGGVRETTSQEWIVDSGEYWSDEVTGYQCSVCGTRQ